MKLKNLEMALQKIQGFSHPDAALEQYLTPPDLAARFLFDAYMHQDLDGLRVLDLGCGTGMLSIGAALLGAAVTGIDCDPSALSVARGNAALFDVPVEFSQMRLPAESIDAFDTVVMNPPFGAQNEHADRPFIETALAAAPVVWGIFNAGSIPFIRAYTKGKAEMTAKVSAQLTIPRQFVFHTQDRLEIPVEIVRLERT
ncbi:MAG TPA: METTL5 family protein [Methanocorpusculum sp.]|nr:METTL5 family protein [Methanocorpusculum sp.]